VPDLTVIGGGPVAHECGGVLRESGFQLGYALAPDDRDRSPVVLGDLPNVFALARDLLQAGRSILITNPAALTTHQLASRNPRQALFLGSSRRCHPAYRFLNSLMQSDTGSWRPRFLQQTVFDSESTSPLLIRWLAIESIALAIQLTKMEPEQISAPPRPRTHPATRSTSSASSSCSRT
jgi:hypothetical protein